MPEPETKISEPLGMRRILWAIIILAVALRIAMAFYQGNEVKALPGIADQISYDRLAVRVLEGHGFSFDVGWWPVTPAGEPTAHWSYLYVLFLAAVYALFGPNPIAPRLIQAVLVGILQPFLTYRIGRRLFGERAGAVSAALSALYAYFIYYSGSLMTEAFYVTAILWALDIALALAHGASARSGIKKFIPWILLGLAFGAAVLLRQVFLPLVPLILLWLAWKLHYRNRVHSAAQILGRAAITIAVLIACIAPWTLRNYRAFSSFVLLNTNAGFAFFWGNHPIQGTDFVPILPADQYGYLIPNELRGMNEAEMDKALLKRGFDFVREDPLRYLLLSANRIKEYIRFWPSYDSGSAANILRFLSSGIFLPVAVWGLLLALRTRIKKTGFAGFDMGTGTSLLLVTGGAYTIIHLMTWTLIRYRLPVDAVFMPFAALSLVAAYDFFINRAKGLVR